MYSDNILIVCSVSHDHFNYVDFIHTFEDFNGLNITVIVKIIMAAATSQTFVILVYFYLDIPSQNSYARYNSWCF